MRIDLTRQNIATTFLMTLSLLVLFCYRAYVHSALQIGGNIADHLPEVIGLILIPISILACCWKAIRIVVNYTALNIHTYTPAIIFTIYSGIHLDPSSIRVILATYLLMCFLLNIFRTLNTFESTGKILNAYTLLGMALILYPPMIIYALLWPVTMTMMTRSWRFWFSSAAGVLAPFAIYLYINHFFLGRTVESIYNYYLGLFSSPKIDLETTIQAIDFTSPLTIVTLVLVVTTLALIVLSALSSYEHSKSMRKQQHNSFILTNYLFLIIIVTILFCNQGIENIDLIALPLSIVLPTYFNYNSGKITNILYFLLLISSVALVLLK